LHSISGRSGLEVRDGLAAGVARFKWVLVFTRTFFLSIDPVFEEGFRVYYKLRNTMNRAV